MQRAGMVPCYHRYHSLVVLVQQVGSSLVVVADNMAAVHTAAVCIGLHMAVDCTE